MRFELKRKIRQYTREVRKWQESGVFRELLLTLSVESLLGCRTIDVVGKS